MKNKKAKSVLSAKELSVIALFTAITAVFAQIAIPLPFTPVPISFGLVAVYMSGILLKPKHAVYSQLCYLTLGGLGIPVFGGFRGGLGALFGPTGGYLLVYPIMAWLVSMVLNSQKSRQNESSNSKGFLLFKSAVAICTAHIILYLGGTTWLSITTGNSFYATLAIAVFPFIPMDILKIIFCIFAVVPIRSRLISTNFLIIDNTKADFSE
ncbi:MAG TPA: biotin transporter BioY [Defluviitaleaceae bacterium]|jgi:biotin transport system substrate-specific component|nr:biotin transporter BioY [Candidatus Epulonipiscium sp.]HOQ17482.1 biotin transporter BioY [Defluviitaleaceae bacterium]HPT77273.1 biotin transporter BioY [Defluviitaleaceae bacterium]HQD50349.1 biotin transporter BioY [Defluviitaleaceae bacterium]